MMNFIFTSIVINTLGLSLLFKYLYPFKQQYLKIKKKAELLEGEAIRLRVEISQIHEDNHALRQSKLNAQLSETTRSELEKLSTTLEQRNRDLDTLVKEITQQKATLNQLKTTKKKFQARITDFKQEFYVLKKEKTSLNLALYSMRQQMNKLQDNHQSLEKTCATLESQCNNLRQEIEGLGQEKQSFDMKIDNLEEASKTLKSKIQREGLRLRKEIEALEENKQSLNIEISNSKKTINHLKIEIKKLEDEYLRILEDHGLELEKYPELMKKQEELIQIIKNKEAEKIRLSEHLTQVQANAKRGLQGIQRVKIVSDCCQHRAKDVELFHAKVLMNFGRVEEALDFAEIMFGDILEVWDSARISAQMSNFIRPDDAYRSLQRLAWFGEYYFNRNGEIGSDLYSFLREQYNLECSSESTTLENNKKLRAERCFWHVNKQKEMFDHLKIGGGRGMDYILRIYFAINRESQKIEIGHCGKHLRN